MCEGGVPLALAPKRHHGEDRIWGCVRTAVMCRGQNNKKTFFLNAAMIGRMVPSDIAYRSSGATQSRKDLRGARTNLALATLTLNYICAVFCWLELVHVSNG